ncbi:MAG: hypothetical protein ACF8TS_07855 [Maioricimonas sp. JB049]
MKCESRKFQAEQLEERVLLAVNVALGLLAGPGPNLAVSLTGDADANSVAVSTDGVGAGAELTIEGLNGTALTPGAINIPLPILAGLIVDTDFDGTSASFVTFNNVVVDALAGNLGINTTTTVDLGDGADWVAASNTEFGGNVTINTGAGNDAVILTGNQFDGDVTIDTGDGKDLLHATFNVFGDNLGPFEVIDVNMGAGNDLLEYGGNIFQNTASPVVIDGGDGHDRQDWIHGTPDDQYLNTVPYLPNWEVFDHADDSPTGA